MKNIRYAVCVGLLLFSTVAAAQDKPNILIIWGDDIGWNNVSAYNRGMMGYDTPNIDSIANDGMMFTDACITSPTAANFRHCVMGNGK